ncbi:unnamed protein product, partial [Choristocarpus tenellus]
ILFVQVGYAAFGKWGARLSTFVMLVLTVFVLIAYMVLAKDIWSGLVAYALEMELDERESNQIGYRSVEKNNQEPQARAEIKLVADNWGDVMEAFPILSLAYLCHFNMLSVQSQLVNPTRERLKGLLHGTVGMASFLYLVMGMSGYMYAYGQTKV